MEQYLIAIDLRVYEFVAFTSKAHNNWSRAGIWEQRQLWQVVELTVAIGSGSGRHMKISHVREKPPATLLWRPGVGPRKRTRHGGTEACEPVTTAHAVWAEWALGLGGGAAETQNGRGGPDAPENCFSSFPFSERKPWPAWTLCTASTILQFSSSLGQKWESRKGTTMGQF